MTPLTNQELIKLIQTIKENDAFVVPERGTVHFTIDMDTTSNELIFIAPYSLRYHYFLSATPAEITDDNRLKLYIKPTSLEDPSTMEDEDMVLTIYSKNTDILNYFKND